jgi:hypothetical protein
MPKALGLEPIVVSTKPFASKRFWLSRPPRRTPRYARQTICGTRQFSTRQPRTSGVDSANGGRLFALLAALDLVLTSDHEWCTYAELPGIGIHQLVTAADGDDAVTTARFTWNGQELATADLPFEDA